MIENLKGLALSDEVEIIVMTTEDWDRLKQEVEASGGFVRADPEATGNRLWGVEILASDMWAGPPRALSRSEAVDFRGRHRTVDLRMNPVKL